MLSGECREYSGGWSGGVSKHQVKNQRAGVCMVLSALRVCLPPTISAKCYQIIFQKPDYFSNLRNVTPAIAVFLPQGDRQRLWWESPHKLKSVGESLTLIPAGFQSWELLNTEATRLVRMAGVLTCCAHPRTASTSENEASANTPYYWLTPLLCSLVTQQH